MKITKEILKQIIKEKIQKTLTEDKKSEYEAAAQKMTDERLAKRIKLLQSSSLDADGKLRLKVLETEAARRKTV